MRSLPPNDSPLSEELVDRVLDRLGLGSRPRADLDGLAAIYDAWCRGVPFDNSRKLLHLATGAEGPLAGDNATEFLEAWLRWGTGGTCWAGNGPLCMLLEALGFDAVRGVGTMLVVPNLPPNHGTVVVRLAGRRWLVDASMLFGRPLLLDEHVETVVEHPAWGVRCSKRDGFWHVSWRPLHMPSGLDCRIDVLETGAAEFSARHEDTRGWSPFNYQINVRRNVGDRVVGIAFGQRVEIDGRGHVTSVPIDAAERRRVLVEEIGLAPGFADRVPADKPTPPPPWSQTATAADAG